MHHVDEVRKQFEYWMSDEGKFPKAIERSRAGDYILMVANLSWKAWQAAINSVGKS